jgi:hypothetical protein
MDTIRPAPLHEPLHDHVQHLTYRGLVSRPGDTEMRRSRSTCRDGNSAGSIGQREGANYDTIPRISESSRQMDGEWQGIAANSESPDFVYCPNARKEDDHILFGDGGGAGLLGGEADDKRRASSCAVPFVFVLVLLRATSCICHGSLLRQMSAPGEVKSRYISRGAPSREPKKSSLHLSGISYETQFSPWLPLIWAM